MQAATGAMEGHLDGVWWVEFARLEGAALAPAAVIDAIAVRELPGQGPAGHTRRLPARPPGAARARQLRACAGGLRGVR
jgi:hypothetical protein